MLSFYHVTVSKRLTEESTQWRSITYSPHFSCAFTPTRNSGVAQDPQLAFQLSFKPFPFSVSKADSYLTQIIHHLLGKLSMPEERAQIYHVSTFRTKTSNFSPLSRRAAVHRYHIPAYWASIPNKWASHNYKYLPQSLNRQYSLWGTDRSWFYRFCSWIIGFQRDIMC